MANSWAIHNVLGNTLCILTEWWIIKYHIPYIQRNRNILKRQEIFLQIQTANTIKRRSQALRITLPTGTWNRPLRGDGRCNHHYIWGHACIWRASCRHIWYRAQGARMGRRHVSGGRREEGNVSYTHVRAHETVLDLVCRLLLWKKKLSKTRTKTK